MENEEVKLLTCKQFCKKGQWPTEGSLRSIILEASRNKNNFGAAFYKVGRRVLIDPKEFWKCVKRKGKKDEN